MALSAEFIYLAARLAPAVDERKRNNCMHVSCWVHIFSGSFGSFGSVVDKRTICV